MKHNNISTVYYLLAILGMGVKAYEVITEYLSKNNLSILSVISYGFLMALVFTIPSLVKFLIERNDGHKIRNPNLRLSKRESNYEIGKNKVTIIETDDFEVLKDGVAGYFRYLSATGGTTVSVQLISTDGSSLHRPIPIRNKEMYQIKFRDGIKKGDKVTIKLKMTIDDPDGKMNRFLADAFMHFNGYGEYFLKAKFLQKPKSIAHEVYSTVTDNVIEGPVMLSTTESMEIDPIRVDKVIPNMAYSISWEW